jgi:hypothetical protein
MQAIITLLLDIIATLSSFYITLLSNITEEVTREEVLSGNNNKNMDLSNKNSKY